VRSSVALSSSHGGRLRGALQPHSNRSAKTARDLFLGLSRADQIRRAQSRARVSTFCALTLALATGFKSSVTLPPWHVLFASLQQARLTPGGNG
jgi:hypothetical protein